MSRIYADREKHRTFQAISILLSILSTHAKLPRSLLGRDDLESGQDLSDLDNRLARLVRSWHGDFHIAHFHELWRDILQFDDVEKFELFTQALEDLTKSALSSRMRLTV